MTQSRWIIFALICVLTLGGLVLFAKKDSVSVDSIDPSKAVSETATEIGDHVYGNKTSKVVFIEYGDFQCPSCAGAFPQVKAIKEEYKDKIAFVYRHFPLTNIHPNALAAATVAEAAGLQGKFWEMHDKLFINQNSWSNFDATKRTDLFVGYANDLGLDVEKLKTDMSDPKIRLKVNRDRALGNKIGVQSTPTFFLGSEQVNSDLSKDLVQADGNKFRAKLDALLKAAE